MSADPVRLAERLALRLCEAAAALGISEKKLREMLPTIPHFRDGGTVLIPVPGLERWLEDRAKQEQGRVDTTADGILRALEDS